MPESRVVRRSSCLLFEGIPGLEHISKDVHDGGWIETARRSYCSEWISVVERQGDGHAG